MRLERLKLSLYSRQPDLVATARPGNHEHILEIRLEFSGQRERPGKFRLDDDAGRVRRRAERLCREKDDGGIGKQLALMCAEKLESDVTNRNDDVETLPLVFQPQVVTKRRRIARLGEPPDLDELGV